MRSLLILPLFYAIYAGLLLAVTVLIAPTPDGPVPDLSDGPGAVMNGNAMTGGINGRTAPSPVRSTPHPDQERIDELQLF